MRFLSLIAVVILFSCNNPKKRSIFENLTLDELKSEIEKDSLFETTYKLVELKRDSLVKNDIDKIKWTDLTYARLHEFVRFVSDSSQNNKYEKDITLKWNNKYKPVLARVDSTIQYWKQFLKENSLEQYVNIELVSIEKEYYTYTSGVRQVNLGFKLTPIKGKIDQLIFSYNLEAKINETKQSEYSLLSTDFDRSRCLMSRPFSKPIVKYWKAGYSDEDILKSRSVESLLRDYNLNLRVEEIRINGNNINRDSLGVPEPIMSYWRYQEYESLKENSIEEIASDLIGLEYTSLASTMNKKIDSILSGFDKLSYDFIKLN